MGLKFNVEHLAAHEFTPQSLRNYLPASPEHLPNIFPKPSKHLPNSKALFWAGCRIGGNESYKVLGAFCMLWNPGRPQENHVLEPCFCRVKNRLPGIRKTSQTKKNDAMKSIFDGILTEFPYEPPVPVQTYQALQIS